MDAWIAAIFDGAKGFESPAFWMQTIGAALFAVKRCCTARVRLPAHDSRGAHGLLCLAAVTNERREQERCQGRVDILS
jgi:hypothetical protein